MIQFLLFFSRVHGWVVFIYFMTARKLQLGNSLSRSYACAEDSRGGGGGGGGEGGWKVISHFITANSVVSAT